jgi:hypothetical protein
MPVNVAAMLAVPVIDTPSRFAVRIGELVNDAVTANAGLTLRSINVPADMAEVAGNRPRSCWS